MSLACTSFAAEAIGLALQKNVMIEDVTANAHHGVYVGDFTSKTDGAYMDGTLDQFGVIPDHADLRITTTSGVFSIEFWIRASSFAADGGTVQRVIGKNEDASNQWAVAVQDDVANSGGRLVMGVDYAGVTYSMVGNIGNNVIPYGTLAHCVITMNATTPLLYVNGILVTATAGAPGLGSGANFLLGRMGQNSSTGRFTGILCRVAYYPDVLTPIEILTHYAAGEVSNPTIRTDVPSTNMITRSQELSDASWTKVRSSVSADTTTAPNGTTTADTLIEDATAASLHYVFKSNVAATAGIVYTWSVYAKAKERTQIRLGLFEGVVDADGFSAYYNLSTGAVISSASIGTGTLYSASMVDVGSGWYRCIITGIPMTTGTTLDAICYLALNGSSTINGDGVSGVYLWGAQLEQKDAVHRYIPTAAAAVTISSYNATILLDAPKALWPMQEGSAAQLDSWPQKPINVSIGGVSRRSWIRVGTLNISDTLGEQMTCSFTVVNPTDVPVVGNVVRVLYYDLVLFAGTIDRIKNTSNNTGTDRNYACTCSDWSQILIRTVVERNFTNTGFVNIVDSLLDNELAGEGLTLGTVDRGSSIPLADSDGGSAFDLIRDVSAVTGQTFFVDTDKKLQFNVTSNASAPITIDVNSIQDALLTTDRETYRNVQRVGVKGTVASSASEDALLIVSERSSESEIATRAALEGGSGRYENYEEVTHPTSNAQADLILLGIGYANLRLATSGTPRRTLSCTALTYGFRAGQFATATISLLGVTGSWLVQRATLQDIDGRKLQYVVELVQSSLQQRAYESWLRIVKSGKIVVQMPSAITSNIQSFTTAGVDTWTVPAGVVLAEFTCYGAGGGGSGAMGYWDFEGAAGGPGGKAITTISVIEGQVYDITVGAGGAAGVSTGGIVASPLGTDGTIGNDSKVMFGATVHAKGDGGGGALAAALVWPYLPTTGMSGNGQGDAVSIGGGSEGGIRGIDLAKWPSDPSGAVTQPAAGNTGKVEVRW